jgi:hypothetical protein
MEKKKVSLTDKQESAELTCTYQEVWAFSLMYEEHMLTSIHRQPALMNAVRFPSYACEVKMQLEIIATMSLIYHQLGVFHLPI